MASRPSPTQTSELRTRVLSAAITAPIAVAAVVAGGFPFAFLVAVVGAVALWEWCVVTNASEPLWASAAALCLLVAGLFAVSVGAVGWAVALIGGPALLALLAGVANRQMLWLGCGLVYVAVPCIGFLILREAAPFGWAAIVFVLVVVWATDIAAYFGGRSMGGPKLWPSVSPKKTWSGALTGLAAAILVGGLTGRLVGPGAAWTGLLLAAPLSIASQAGDLLESALKRRFGVKDSGKVIPGHGGVLDRVDGLFAAASLAWLIAALGLGGILLVLPDVVTTAGGAP